jgi:uroporphyrinogen III methyltransferase/synthase
VIEIYPPSDTSELDEAIAALSGIDYLVLTSANAVQAFFSRLEACGKDVRALHGTAVAVVGPKTAEALALCGLKPDLVARDFRAEGVLEILREHGVAGKRILYPRAELARELIPKELAAAGAVVLAPVAYCSRLPADGERIREILAAGDIDAITFTASSTVDNFVALVGADAAALVREIPLFSIGPLTSQTMARHGLSVAAESDPSTLEAMVETMIAHFAQGGSSPQTP